MSLSHSRTPAITNKSGDIRVDSNFEEEIALIARLREGDTEAFRALSKHYLNMLTRFAYYMSRSRDLADDIVQHVLIGVWENRVSLEPDRSLKSYLFRSIRNRALDERKAAMVRDRYKDGAYQDAVAGVIHAYTPSPESGILTTITVQNAIDQLSERRQLAVRLRLEEGMSHAEIAEVLQLTPENAKRLVARSITELRKILGVSH